MCMFGGLIACDGISVCLCVVYVCACVIFTGLVLSSYLGYRKSHLFQL